MHVAAKKKSMKGPIPETMLLEPKLNMKNIMSKECKSCQAVCNSSVGTLHDSTRHFWAVAPTMDISNNVETA
jgi:hypothetical protein